jgi:hypothetical protein
MANETQCTIFLYITQLKCTTVHGEHTFTNLIRIIENTKKEKDEYKVDFSKQSKNKYMG